MRNIPKKGYLTVINGFGAPILIHWTFPIGGIFVSIFLGDHSATAVISLVAAYSILALVHEAGHAIAAKYHSLEVHALIITGVGGWCIASEPESKSAKLLFYSGGLLAQSLLFVVALALVLSFDKPPFPAANYFTFVFIFVNTILFIINLVPTKGTDGIKIWQFIRS